MFATVILDAYRRDEAALMAKALDEVCDPEGHGAFTSCGIYAYWDYPTRELLYLGLASDHAQRFRQHNGLVACRPECCKVREIGDYFTRRDKLGYSILVISPNDQIA